MFRFIHAADIHLDSPLKGLELPEDAPLEEIRAASRRALENMVDLAIREEVAFVLIAGDLYDGEWRDFNTGLFFNQCMVKLRDAGIRVFVVSGNHDAANQMTTTLQLPDNVHMFSSRKAETFTIDNINVAVHGQSFANRAVSDNLSLNYPKAKSGHFNIGLLHTALTGREGHEPYAPCSADDLSAKGYQYWALGHVHKREEVHNDPWIVFSGNIQGRHIRETGAKGCTMVTVDGNQVSKIEHITLDVLRWNLYEVDLKDCLNTDEVCDRVQRVFEKALADSDGHPVIVRLHLKGETDAHQKLHSQFTYWTEEFRAIAANLGGTGVWLEKVKMRTKEQTDYESLIQADTPLGMLLSNLKDLAIDVNKLNELDPDMTTFLNKLPAEIRGGDDPFDPSDPKQWDEIISDVKDHLVARLINEGQAK
jgi:DNA repair exonuclease SbcCD nuclease subunit